MRIPGVLIVAFLFTASCVLVLAQAPAEEIPTLPDDYVLSPHKKRLPIQSWQRNRVFAGSNAAPMAKWLQTRRAARRATFEVLKFFKRVERQMLHLTNISSAPNATPLEKARVCNVTCCIANYKGARYSTSLNGYGVLPSDRCVTELVDDGTDEHFIHFKLFATELNRVAKDVSNLVFANWTQAKTSAKFEYSTNYEKCEMVRAVGYRIDGFWAVIGAITNANVHAQLADWKRHYMVEAIVRRPDGRLDAFPSYMRDHKTNKIVKATTSYSRWGFRPTSSFFGPASLEKNPAIRAAIDRSERLKQQAEDTTTPSNTLILMLPLWMAAVPIALFSDVSRIVAIGYSIATDIMSAMPLAIKGIELLRFAAGRHLTTRTFVFGMRDPKSFAIAESWSAECTVVSSMHSRGLI